MRGEIIELKKELDTKSGKIDQIESELEHVKKTLQHKVHLSEFAEVERDVISIFNNTSVGITLKYVEFLNQSPN